MTNNITTARPFDFAPGMSLQAIVRDGQPWFVAKDLCDALDITNSRDAVTALDADERQTVAISYGIRGNPNRTIVNESGMYALIFRSIKPEAKAFRKWVTSAVLPSLRRDGVYIAGQEKPITDELTLPELMEQITTIQAKVSAALDAINTAKVRAWSRHQEEKEARSDAFRFLKGKAPRVRL